MDRWQGKVAVVTGASAGIGSSICLALADAGVIVVGLARRAPLVDKLKSAVKGKGRIVSRQCDVSSAEDVAATFKWVEQEYGGLHILVNNAGVLHFGQITDVGDNPLSETNLVSTIDINVKGPIICTKLAVSIMKRHNFDGHILTINSIAGHYIPLIDTLNVYPTTKHAITAFHNSLATELASFNSKIKTTSISPGLVATDMGSRVGSPDDPPAPALLPKDIADAVLYALSTPPTVNIGELTITPVGGRRI